ncbi:MAG: helix-turn-helix domain-containing protein [Acidimicrobiia bacterium]|nr:helix-turn-helix domain-containing protein [Acidimicrobiia bacterium]
MMTRTGKQSGRRSTVISGIKAVEYIASRPHPEGVGLLDIARAIDMDAGQAHRLLSALIEAGWVHQEARHEHYALTGRFLQVSGQLIRELKLVDVARPVMRELATATGHTVGLLEVLGSSLVLSAREHGSSAVQVMFRVRDEVGDFLSLHETPGGRAVLAAGGDTDRDGDPALAGRLERIRDRGFEIDDEEYRESVRTVASAILDRRNRPIGVLGLMTPATLVSLEEVERFGELVKDAATEISRLFGSSAAIDGPNQRP